MILENERGDDLSISARATRDEMFVVTPIKVPWFNRELNRRPELLPPYVNMDYVKMFRAMALSLFY